MTLTYKSAAEQIREIERRKHTLVSRCADMLPVWEKLKVEDFDWFKAHFEEVFQNDAIEILRLEEELRSEAVFNRMFNVE